MIDTGKVDYLNYDKNFLLYKNYSDLFWNFLNYKNTYKNQINTFIVIYILATSLINFRLYDILNFLVVFKCK